MYSKSVFVLSLVVLMFFSTMNAELSDSGQESDHSDVELKQCNEKNYGRRKLVKDKEGKENSVICSKQNGVYLWKKETMETEIHDENEITDDIMLKREAAAEFFERFRRGLNHECYAECCSWEEVREHYEHDMRAAERYWRTYRRWKIRYHRC
ncbi:uncharacterized protein LOC114519120 [Dendronephthya gigantea]|uniref:uncharacterized protein LOC114519120 n=1 Tax=Dendronephthya gigantea TaxID=151771 RepID=UPI00106D1B1A|nr:uncharacterized protein LOC114519120 [Dendronephthya gigantea]XP_028394992.1 uncharacterized protein LOC114519120 [Dendronephthya gigantea]